MEGPLAGGLAGCRKEAATRAQGLPAAGRTLAPVSWGRSPHGLGEQRRRQGAGNGEPGPGAQLRDNLRGLRR